MKLRLFKALAHLVAYSGLVQTAWGHKYFHVIYGVYIEEYMKKVKKGALHG